MSKEIIIDGVDVSNFCLVCYYDNKTNELVRIEQYNDNDSSMHSDIQSYEYGYSAKIVKPEEIIKQLKRKEQECEELKKNYFTVIQQRNTAEQQLDQYIDIAMDNVKLEMKNSILEDEYKILEDNLDSRTRDFEEVIDNYKQALQEIKEIAEDYPLTVHAHELAFEQILQRISEVEDEI